MDFRILTVTLSVLLAACAGTTDRESARSVSDEDCFFARSVSDWRALDDESLVVFAGRRNPYYIELAVACTSLRFRETIAFSDRDGLICSYGGDAVLTEDTVPQRCLIASVRGISEEELEALYVERGIRDLPPPTPEPEVEVEE